MMLNMLFVCTFTYVHIFILVNKKGQNVWLWSLKQITTCLFFMSVVYILVIWTVVVQTHNGTQRGMRAWVSINYNQMSSFQKKPPQTLQCVYNMHVYLTERYSDCHEILNIRDFSDSSFNGRYLHLQKCYNRQYNQVWVSHITYKFVLCVLYYDPFASSFKGTIPLT